jgi:hypothetical protein
VRRVVARLYLHPEGSEAHWHSLNGQPPPEMIRLVSHEQDQDGTVRDGALVWHNNGPQRLVEVARMTRPQLVDLLSQGIHLLGYLPVSRSIEQ